jgi:site-specific recombinase XerD
LSERLEKVLKDGREYAIGERPSLKVLSAYFQKISRKAGLSGNIHTLRHTYASHLVQNGVDLYTVSKLLGHTTIKTTQIYAHLAPHSLIAAIDRLPLVRI